METSIQLNVSVVEDDQFFLDLKHGITKKLNQTDNFSFNFIQTIGGKDEKGECVIQYPKKMFCKYDSRKNKIIVSSSFTSSIVFNSDRLYDIFLTDVDGSNMINMTNNTDDKFQNPILFDIPN